MKKKRFIWIVAISAFLVIAVGLLCWAAYKNQPTFCGMTRSELETYDIYFNDTLVTEQKVRDQVITCCLNMDFFRQRVSIYEAETGGKSAKHYITFQKGNTNVVRYRIFFDNVEEQLAWDYIHRDQPIVAVAHQEENWSDLRGAYAYSQQYVHYYCVSPEDYSMLLNLMTSSWDNLT